MKILMYGVSQETVSTDDIERYRLDEQTQAKHVTDIKQFIGVEEVALLSTNKRNEYYLHVDETIFKHGDLLRYLSQFTDKPLKEVILETYSLFNEDVIRHLYSVTCGMESTPKGSLEPLESTKDALCLSEKNKAMSFVLKDLFQRAIEYAHKMKQSSTLAPLQQIHSCKALDYLKEGLTEVKNKDILLFGDGLEVKFLIHALFASEVNTVTLAHANKQVSEELCKEFKDEEFAKKLHATDLKNVGYRLASSDGVIISSSVQHAWISKELLEEVFTIRQTKKKQVMIDLSDVQEDHLFYHHPLISYYSTDDLTKKKYTEEQKEEAITHYDESLLHESDRFMEKYHQFLGKKDTSSAFAKVVPEFN